MTGSAIRSASILILLAVALAGGTAAAQVPAASSQATPGASTPSLARAPHRRKPLPERPVEVTHMALDDWASLAPAYGPLGKPEPRVDLHAHDDNAEDIVVYGRKFARPVQDLSVDAIGAEPSQSDAAQPMVPFLGSGCDKGSACIDPAQQGLFSTLPSLFGSH